MGLEITTLNAKLAELGLTKQVAALLLGASGTDLSRWLSGVKNFPNSEFLKLNKTLDELLHIRQVIAPLSLPLSDVQSLKVLLERYQDSGLDRITDIETLAEMRVQIQAIRNIHT
jgi:hypothetical protein